MLTIAQSLFEEGRREGLLQAQLSTLLRQGKRRFGPPSEQQAATLNGLTDIDHLDRMIDCVYDGQSWEEVLRVVRIYAM